jgi:hypothetical protein
MGLLERFGKEQSREHHGDHLTWPGTAAGFPILGKVPGLLKESEYEELDHKFTYHVQMFRMWIPDDCREYVYVQERAVNGWFKILDRDRIWDAENQNYMIWVEWIQIYGVAPPVLPDAIHQLTARPGGTTFDAVQLQTTTFDQE